MNQLNEIQKQQHQRFIEIFNQGKQRYIQAVGNSKGYLAGVKGKDYLSNEEREEAKQLLRQMFEKYSPEELIQSVTTNLDTNI